MKKLACALTLYLIPAAATASHFGIGQGTNISTLKVLEKEGQKTYRVQVPEPNSNFESYWVMATPSTGVCAVYGETKSYSTWSEAKAKRESVAKLLTKYGKPTHVKPNLDYATLSVRPPVEAYDLEWRKLAAPLSAVSLDVVGRDGGQIVRLTYFFRNMAQCHTWEPRQDRRGL